MFTVAISQLTTSRWELPTELAHLAEHGFDAVSMWRPKLSDMGLDESAAILSRSGVRVSSLQWAGGFTGGDGRSFAESVADAREAIDTVAALGGRILIVHAGCRGGHTLSHARRLLLQALETILPAAERAAVTLAVKPFHAAAGCSFLTRLREAADLIERFDAPALRLSLDLWQFGHEPEVRSLAPRLAALAAVVQVADRHGPPSCEQERVPAGHGSLPLEEIVAALVEQGYAGDIEFDPVGEAVESLGYEQVLDATRQVAGEWKAALQAGRHSLQPADAAVAALPDAIRSRTAQFRPAGFRRSHASSQIVSRG
jgi:sugar phosphate isomerase/epimerase